MDPDTNGVRCENTFEAEFHSNVPGPPPLWISQLDVQIRVRILYTVPSMKKKKKTLQCLP